MEAPAKDSPLEFIDAHCHLDLFGKQEATVLRAAEEHRVHVIAVTNAPAVFFHTRDLAQRQPLVYPALGLHPELVHSHARELNQLEQLLAQTRFVGEIGLDYVTPDHGLRRQQRDVFSRILSACAQAGDKVLSVHSRRAATDVIAAIGGAFPGTVILHWFSGSRRELERAIQAGCWFSVNPNMLRTQSGNLLIDAMPCDRVLTETDGPFVTVGPSPARPEQVKLVVEGLAQKWNESFEDAARHIWANFQRAIHRSQ